MNRPLQAARRMHVIVAHHYIDEAEEYRQNHHLQSNIILEHPPHPAPSAAVDNNEG
jgi:hypothetical protein